MNHEKELLFPTLETHALTNRVHPCDRSLAKSAASAATGELLIASSAASGAALQSSGGRRKPVLWSTCLLVALPLMILSSSAPCVKLIRFLFHDCIGYGALTSLITFPNVFSTEFQSQRFRGGNGDDPHANGGAESGEHPAGGRDQQCNPHSRRDRMWKERICASFSGEVRGKGNDDPSKRRRHVRQQGSSRQV